MFWLMCFFGAINLLAWVSFLAGSIISWLGLVFLAGTCVSACVSFPTRSTVGSGVISSINMYKLTEHPIVGVGKNWPLYKLQVDELRDLCFGLSELFCWI